MKYNLEEEKAFQFKMKSEWSSLGLSKAILDTLEEMQFHTMTPVQVRKLKNIIFPASVQTLKSDV